jgi:antitoxin component of RelBE/YafQ-DinJ toxin-antitoxin module
VAKNKQTPTEVLRALALDADEIVRMEVAENKQTPAEVLRSLALDVSAAVRWNVAQNKQTPAEVLRSLALDASAFVRRDAAMHEHTPAEVLRALALDADEQVRQNVAKNEQTPAEVLRTLALDVSAAVRWNVAKNKQTPTEVLRALALDADEIVRMAVAENKQMPAEVLRALALDTDKGVQWLANLALRHSVENEKRMERERWRDDLRKFAQVVPLSVEEQLDQIVSMEEAPDAVRQILLEVCAAEWDAPLIRDAFSENLSYEDYEHLLAPFLPAIALAKLAASPLWEVRCLIALHEQTPQETRQRLCQDGNRYVRALARATIAQITEQATD